MEVWTTHLVGLDEHLRDLGRGERLAKHHHQVGLIAVGKTSVILLHRPLHPY